MPARAGPHPVAMPKSWRGGKAHENGPRNELAGSFLDAPHAYSDGVEDQPPDGLDTVLHDDINLFDQLPDQLEPGSQDKFLESTVWSKRAAAANDRWADPDKREQTLKKRRKTAASKGRQHTTSEGLETRDDGFLIHDPHAPKEGLRLDGEEDASLTAAEKRSRAMQLKWSDEERWFKEKMEVAKRNGFDRTDPAAKVERQKKRSEAMKKAWERRRRKAS